MRWPALPVLSTTTLPAVSPIAVGPSIAWAIAWALAAALAGALSFAAPAQAAEAYDVTATATLAVTTPSTIHQTWTAVCAATDPAKDAGIRPQGKDLRFVAAPDEVLAVSVDDSFIALDGLDGGEVDGSYDYEDVVGANVFARFVVVCGGVEVVDEFSVDSAPIVTAPKLAAPFAVRRLDTFETVPADEVPAGVRVELVELGVLARPRGDERVVVSFVDAGGATLSTVELSAVDVGIAGRADISPAFTTSALGDVSVTASFLGQSSTALLFTVVEDDGGGEGEGEGEGEEPDGPSSVSCASSSPPGLLTPSALALALLLRRRRRLQRR